MTMKCQEGTIYNSDFIRELLHLSGISIRRHTDDPGSLGQDEV